MKKSKLQQTPTDILTILQAADAEFEDDIDAISNTSLTPTPTPLPITPPARDVGHIVELQDLPTQMANDFLETLSSKENVDRELQLLAGSYKLPETLIMAVKKHKAEQQQKEQNKDKHEQEQEQDEQNRIVKN